MQNNPDRCPRIRSPERSRDIRETHLECFRGTRDHSACFPDIREGNSVRFPDIRGDNTDGFRDPRGSSECSQAGHTECSRDTREFHTELQPAIRGPHRVPHQGPHIQRRPVRIQPSERKAGAFRTAQRLPIRAAIHTEHSPVYPEAHEEQLPSRKPTKQNLIRPCMGLSQKGDTKQASPNIRTNEPPKPLKKWGWRFICSSKSHQKRRLKIQKVLMGQPHACKQTAGMKGSS